MAGKHYFEGVDHVIYISTDVSRRCDHCNQMIGSNLFAESVNHYLSAHNYKLLHVGSETTRDENGNPWHTTIAVLGA